MAGEIKEALDYVLSKIKYLLELLPKKNCY